MEQICRAWREAPLTAGARTGGHAIFLSGPVAVALGARLAAPEHGRWTAFTFDAASDSYEPFPLRPERQAHNFSFESSILKPPCMNSIHCG